MGFELYKMAKHNLYLDYSLIFRSGLKLNDKIFLFINKYFNILLNRRKINYLGKLFEYDNRFTPAMLELYPSEIKDLNRFVPLDKISTILDVGANIGQFSNTINRMYPKISLYSFEPNKPAFNLLKVNSIHSKNIKIFNYGLGKKSGNRTFFYSPLASPEGSFYQENINQNLTRKNVIKTKVPILKLDNSAIKILNLPKHFDLVKIDVEGAEIEVLSSLKNLTFDYLYIEVSRNRKMGGDLEAVKKILKDKLHLNYKLLNFSVLVKESPYGTAIFKIE